MQTHKQPCEGCDIHSCHGVLAGLHQRRQEARGSTNHFSATSRTCNLHTHESEKDRLKKNHFSKWYYTKKSSLLTKTIPWAILHFLRAVHCQKSVSAQKHGCSPRYKHYKYYECSWLEQWFFQVQHNSSSSSMDTVIISFLWMKIPTLYSWATKAAQPLWQTLKEHN